jgi:flotillin
MWMVVLFIMVVVIMLSIAVYASRYQRVPPDKVLVIYGREYKELMPETDAEGRTKMVMKKTKFKLVRGGGQFIVPIVERTGWMSLETNTVEVEVPEVITRMGVPLTVEGVAQVKIRGDDVAIRTAAEQLLEKQQAEIIEIARKTLEGHIRGICATLTIEEINADRAALSQKIQEEAVADFTRLGLQISIFVIKDIKDRVGYLEALGKKRTAEVKRDAEIGAANALRDQTIQVAQAHRDGQIGRAEAIERDMIIRMTQAQRDGAVQRTQREAEIAEAEKGRDVKKASYIKEVKSAEAARDLSYDIESSHQKQELIRQQMQVEIEKKKKEVELQEQEIQMQEKAQVAMQVVPSEKQADAVAALADGERRRLAITSDGEKSKLSLLGEGEAAKIKAIADAEAYRTRITGEAEGAKVIAIGQSEAKAMQLKADAWRQYTDAAKLQMIIERLPEIANAMSKPLENTQKIIIMGNEGSSALVRSSADAIAKLPAVVESLTGKTLMELVEEVAGAVKGNQPPKQ